MEFWNYSGAVSAYIRFKPDRPEVEWEIMAHLEDRRDAYMRQGLTRQEAEQKAVASMGDPEEVGKALDRLHSPLLGWFQIWFGRAVCLVIVVAVLSVFPWLSSTLITLTAWPESYDYSFWDAAPAVADYRPEGEWRYDGYVFSIERALVYRYENSEQLGLHYRIMVTHANPWIRGPEFRMWLYAEDDLGNHYPSRGEEAERGGADPQRGSAGNPVGYGYDAFVSYYDLWVSGIEPDARELTVCFDRYGEKAILLAIPLEGGEHHA